MAGHGALADRVGIGTDISAYCGNVCLDALEDVAREDGVEVGSGKDCGFDGVVSGFECLGRL